MRIKQLYIHNIASIENAFIDFDAEPLKSSDLFLISGMQAHVTESMPMRTTSQVATQGN